jgi:hypothetical protein
VWADCLENVGASTSHNPMGLTACYRIALPFFFTLYKLTFTIVFSFALAGYDEGLSTMADQCPELFIRTPWNRHNQNFEVRVLSKMTSQYQSANAEWSRVTMAGWSTTLRDFVPWQWTRWMTEMCSGFMYNTDTGYIGPIRTWFHFIR